MGWPSDDTLTSAQRKLKRGIEHLQTLRGETAAFEDDDAYLFESEDKPRSSEEVEYRCFAIQRKSMPHHWPLLAGEAIQNLRSALDHLVYELSGGNRRSQFPIFTDPCEFKVLGSRKLKGVPEARRAMIEKAQPYRHMPTEPTEHPLALLSSLSNLDKHRVLATFASAVVNEAVGISNGEVNWEDFASNKRLGPGKAHISTFVVQPKGKAVEVNVETFFSYEVRIEGRPVSTLTWIGNSVYRAFAEIDAGEPLPLFAPSPL